MSKPYIPSVKPKGGLHIKKMMHEKLAGFMKKGLLKGPKAGKLPKLKFMKLKGA